MVQFFFFIHPIYSWYSRGLYHLCNGKDVDHVATSKFDGNQASSSLLKIANGMQAFGAWPTRGCTRISTLSNGGHGKGVPDTFPKAHTIRSVQQRNGTNQSNSWWIFEDVRAMSGLWPCVRDISTFRRSAAGHSKSEYNR